MTRHGESFIEAAMSLNPLVGTWFSRTCLYLPRSLHSPVYPYSIALFLSTLSILPSLF